MSLIATLCKELEHEAATTRKLLERITDERLDWKPHAKSMSMRELASHVADIVVWIVPTLETEELTLAPDFKPFCAGSVSEALAHFDTHLAKAKETMVGYPDDKMMSKWALKSGETTYFSLPRAVVLRSFILNHLVHHRGQLSVYLRLNDIPVPAIYGPSADEQA